MTAPDRDPWRFHGADIYQGESIRTDWPDWRARREDGIVHAALGLASEAGELAGLVQKWQGQGHPLDADRVIDEAGDALWFLCKLLRMLDVPLSRVMLANVAKLDARFPAGFDPDRSINRGSEL